MGTHVFVGGENIDPFGKNIPVKISAISGATMFRVLPRMIGTSEPDPCPKLANIGPIHPEAETPTIPIQSSIIPED